MPKGSGLTKPLNLSKELADLIGAKKDEKLSRPEVVKRIWAYLKEKKLQVCDFLFTIVYKDKSSFFKSVFIEN